MSETVVSANKVAAFTCLIRDGADQVRAVRALPLT